MAVPSSRAVRARAVSLGRARGLLALLIGLFAAGCASPVTSTPAVGPSATGVCAPFVGVDPAHPPETLALTADPRLEGMFPKSIGIFPVTALSSGRLVETLCVLGGQASVDAARRNLPPSVALDDISVASADSVADSRPVTISAYRLPGHSGSELVSILGFVSQAVASGRARFAGNPEPTSAGGKQVQRWNDEASGALSYVYATGDTLFVVSDISPSQADQIFATLP